MFLYLLLMHRLSLGASGALATIEAAMPSNRCLVRMFCFVINSECEHICRVTLAMSELKH